VVRRVGRRLIAGPDDPPDDPSPPADPPLPAATTAGDRGPTPVPYRYVGGPQPPEADHESLALLAAARARARDRRPPPGPMAVRAWMRPGPDWTGSAPENTCTRTREIMLICTVCRFVAMRGMPWLDRESRACREWRILVM
jgi:hypothetical protein